MNRRYITLLLCLILPLGVFGQIHVSTDKTTYIAGEQVHCSVFTLDGDAIAYVQLFDTENIAAQTKIALLDGRGGGSIGLPLTLATGNYRLVAYTATGSAESFTVPVYNPFSTGRLSNVKVVDKAPEPISRSALSKGLQIERKADKLILRNTGNSAISACLSIAREDALSGRNPLRIMGFSGITGSRTDAPEADGEILEAFITGPDASKIAGLESVTAVISFPGQKSDVYTCRVESDSAIKVPTENVFGKRDVACMLYGMPQGSVCHIEVTPKIYDGDALVGNSTLYLSPSCADALLSRGRILKAEKASCDTLVRTLPVRRPHFFLEKECTAYNLDDYNRFPTMEEEFVEIIKRVRRRRGEDRTRQLQVAITPDPLTNAFKWGTALAMIDGVPIFNHNQIWTYDPAMVKTIEIYPYEYALGYRVYEGVVNFITFKGDMPIISFDDNVRLYDFIGCSYPVEHKGVSTLYWHPLISLDPSESMEVDCSRASRGTRYEITSEGVSSEGEAVYAATEIVF